VGQLRQTVRQRDRCLRPEEAWPRAGGAWAGSMESTIAGLRLGVVERRGQSSQMTSHTLIEFSCLDLVHPLEW
jgi:hypothetical protein